MSSSIGSGDGASRLASRRSYSSVRVGALVAKESTFPADDLPDRRDEVLAVLDEHAPVPVSPTSLYLAIPDKRHLAETFNALVDDGTIVIGEVAPGDDGYAEAMELAGLEPTAIPTPLRVYRRA